MMNNTNKNQINQKNQKNQWSRQLAAYEQGR